MKRVLFVVVVLVLAISVNAYTLVDYPTFFVEGDRFRAIYVIGEEAPALDVVSATVLSTALVKYPNVTTEIGTSRIDSEIPDVTTKNAIVIGSPCENSAAAKLEGNPVPCNKNLAGSVAYIKLFENNGKVQLLITGLTTEDRYQAAKFLAEKSLQLKVKEYIVPTSTNSTPVFFARNVTNQSNETKQTEKVVEPPKVVQQVGPPAPVTSPPQTEVKEEPKPVQIGEYEPLSEMPEKKGIFARLWGWIKSLF